MSEGTSPRCSDVYNWQALTRAPKIADILAQNEASEAAGTQLKRSLGILDLLGYGVGSTVGAGIYALVGQAALKVGPSVLFSFLIGAFSCVITGFVYAEFSTRVPLAGSAYLFAFVTFGEFVGYFIGWTLTLEYAISSAVVARSWADYVASLLHSFGVEGEWVNVIDNFQCGSSQCSPLAAFLIILCTGILLLGVKDSARFNNVVTVVNISCLVFFMIAGSFKANTSNWYVVNDSFMPYGASSLFTGAGLVFFSYLGFDTVTSMAEEVRKPHRDLPIGIIGTLAIAAGIYIGVCLVATAMVPFTQMDTQATLSSAFAFHHMGWAAKIVSVGALFGLTTSCFTGLMGQPRIFYRMSTDGLLFPFFSRLSPKTQVPILGSLLTGFVTALIAFFISSDILAQAISIGTLLAFCVVDAGLVTLRQASPEHPYRTQVAMFAFITFVFPACIAYNNNEYIATGVLGAFSLIPLRLLCTYENVAPPAQFNCPWVPIVPCFGVFVNLWMIASLPLDTWIRVVIWTVVGLLIYFSYGIRNSALRTNSVNREVDALLAKTHAHRADHHNHEHTFVPTKLDD